MTYCSQRVGDLTVQLSELRESDEVVREDNNRTPDSVMLASSGGNNVTAAITRHHTTAELLAQTRKLRREL